jgi:endonuclease YncB( thermonuclease family)
VEAGRAVRGSGSDVRAAVCLLGIALVLLHSVGQVAELYGQVARVSDGDTITITDAEFNRYRVRLAGVDASERRQAYGKASKKYLASRLIRKPVLVDWHKTDRYGRLVGR